jgi:hypothetical protein
VDRVRTLLYRIGRGAVTLAAGVALAGSMLCAQEAYPQYGKRPEPDKGPRAVGLVQVPANSKKARIIPVAVMIDGKFYDAGSFKASPVPMALDFGVLYEAFRAGVSQGTFTITQPGQLNHNWIAEGTWIAAGEKDPNARKKYTTPKIDDDDANSGKPVLHRRFPKTDDNDSDAKKPEEQKPSSSTSTSPIGSSSPSSGGGGNSTGGVNSGGATTSSTAPGQGTAPAAGTSSTSGATPAPAKPDTSQAQPAQSARPRDSGDGPIQDPNRPRLRRGKPDPSEHTEPFVDFDAQSSTAGPVLKNAGAKDAGAPVPIVTIAAISDAGGPDPRPFTYDLKPAEEAIYRNQMLALATKQLQPKGEADSKTAAKSSKTATAKTRKLAEPEFTDLNLRIFDLSSSNEPVLILSAKTEVPEKNASGKVSLPKEITLIARTNLEGELQKLFFSQTDSQHLDLRPRMELIDAVDADGDGRGELLFRRTFDGGSAYAIYRVTTDGLWPLFEGTP